MTSKNDFYWKYIDIDQEEIQSIKEECYKVLPDNNDFFQDIKLPIKRVIGLNVMYFALIQVQGNSKGTIHTDFRPSNKGFQLALNIPIENCEQSITSIWESDYEPPLQWTHNRRPYNCFDPERCQKITEFKLTQPTLFRIDLPHSVDNQSVKIRKALSVRFTKDPWHLL